MDKKRVFDAIDALRAAAWAEGKAYAARFPETIGHPEIARSSEEPLYAAMRTTYDALDEITAALGLEGARRERDDALAREAEDRLTSGGV